MQNTIRKSCDQSCHCQEKEIEQMLNGLFYLDKDIPKELKFLKSVMTRGAETTERKGLHASAVIVSDDKFCIR